MTRVKTRAALWESEMGRRIPTKTVERPRVEWPDIVSTLEFSVALLIFVGVIAGVGVLWFSTFNRW
jgi:hypothetical protein